MSSRTNALTYLGPLGPRRSLWCRIMLPPMRLLAYSSSQNRLRFIHFGSWTILRGIGRRPYMIFQSDYDGDPDEYLAAFCLQLGGGIRATFGGFAAFPGTKPTRLLIQETGKGRTHELLRYSAYPDATVRDVDSALAVRAGIARLAAIADDSDHELAVAYDDLLAALAHAPELEPRSLWVSAWLALRGRDSVTGVTLLIPLASGQTDKVVDAIRAIADEPSLFDRVGGVHFARMATVQVDGRDFLLVGAWCDGEMGPFLRRFVENLGPRLTPILLCCTDYPGGDDPRAVTDWLARHHHPAALFLPSLNGETVDSVRAALTLRERAFLAVAALQNRPRHEIRTELTALWS